MSEAPFRFKESLMPPLQIDPNILRAGSVQSSDLFLLPDELSQKYDDRMSEIETTNRMRRRRREESKQETRQNIQQDLRKSKQEFETRRLNRQSSKAMNTEKIQKIQSMITYCEGLNDFESAKFYLDAQNWDLEAAIKFYTEYTGMPDKRKSGQINVNFKLPNKSTFTLSFDSNQLLWSMLPVVYNHLPEKRNFKLSKTEGGQPFKEEDMTTNTFKKFGITNGSTIYVKYS